MIYKELVITDTLQETLEIGRQGEHDILTILINCSFLKNKYGNGIPTLMFVPLNKESSFPIPLIENNEGKYSWLVKENVTQYCGINSIILRWTTEEGALAKTLAIPVLVRKSLDYEVVEPPEKYADWVEHLNELIEQAEYDVDPEHIANVIRQYMIDNPIDCYTQEETDFKISEINSKFDNYYTKQQVNEELQPINENLEQIISQDIPDIEYNIQSLDANKMEYFMVTIKDGVIKHENETMNYFDLKEKFDDPSVFLYMVYLNLVFIPSIDVPDSALAFSTAWTRKENYIGSQEEYEQPYIERVMINSNNVIHFSQVQMENPENRINVLIDYEYLEEEYQGSCYPNIKVIKGLEEKLQLQINSKADKLENNYSQIPVTCGRWIDGKEIKRRVYLVTSGIVKGNQIKVADKPANMNLLIKGWGIVEGTDANKKTMTNSDITVFVNNDGVYAVNNFTGYASKLYVVLEYTIV